MKSVLKKRKSKAPMIAVLKDEVLTPAVEKQLKTERDIDQVFDLLAILRNKSERVEFLAEFFKFRLREKI
jgi:hypothetical protein